MEERKAEFEVRTDLAVEQRESFPGDGGEIEGVSLREWREAKGHMKVTEVKIWNRQGARAMGKPEGSYLTLELKRIPGQDDGEFDAVAGELAGQIRSCLDGLWAHAGKNTETCRILVAGLGNPAVTPDALGPRTAAKLSVTRHLDRQYGTGFLTRRGLPAVSAIVPGVTAQTGMETAEILRGIIRETGPDVLIAIDALAARSVRRLGTTIQLTDTGIHPGSGVGNHRHGLTRESLGIPVLAIGVPTVVGAAAIVHDTLHSLTRIFPEGADARGENGSLTELPAEEQYLRIRELLEPEFGSFYVTPPDIDEQIGRLSDILSEGIQGAVY